MPEEGIIKFVCAWEMSPPLPEGWLDPLPRVRCALKRLGWIGETAEGIGYGNLSRRMDAGGRFLITGSQTGGIDQLDGRHFALVERADRTLNRVECRGPVQASSEALSHAAVYAADPQAGAVIHIHQARWWQDARVTYDATPLSAAYGTPELAEAIYRLVLKPAKGPRGALALGGHPEGLLFYGPDAETVLDRMVRDFHTWETSHTSNEGT